MTTVLVVIIVSAFGVDRSEHPMPSRALCEQARRCVIYAGNDFAQRHPDSSVRIAMTYCAELP
jgi:hypothetical protein